MDVMPALVFLCAIMAAVDVLYRFAGDCDSWLLQTGSRRFSLFARTIAALAWQSLILCAPLMIWPVASASIHEPDVLDFYSDNGSIIVLIAIGLAWIATIACAIAATIKKNHAAQ